MLRYLLILLFLPSCAYRFSTLDRDLPGGYTEVAVPVFENMTMEPGIETEFTNAFIRELSRSKKINLLNSGEAPVKIVGKIETLQFVPGSPLTKKDIGSLPEGSILTADYRVLITMTLEMVRESDRAVLWKGRFQGERRYSAPRVGNAQLNSVNPLYNHSSRINTINIIAQDMMLEAHNQLTETF